MLMDFTRSNARVLCIMILYQLEIYVIIVFVFWKQLYVGGFWMFKLLCNCLYIKLTICKQVWLNVLLDRETLRRNIMRTTQKWALECKEVHEYWSWHSINLNKNVDRSFHTFQTHRLTVWLQKHGWFCPPSKYNLAYKL